MRKLALSLLALAILATTSTLQSQNLEVIVVAGDDVSGTTDTITLLGDEPALNENGQIAIDSLVDTGGGNLVNAVLRGEASIAPVEIHRTGSEPPGFSLSFDEHGIADDGTVVFTSYLTNDSTFEITDGFLSGDGTGPPTSVIQVGDRIDGELISGIDIPARINLLGQVVFSAAIDLEDGGSDSDEELICRKIEGGPIVEVVREGDAVPGGGTFTGLNGTNAVVQNNSNQIAFWGQSSEIDSEDGIFRVDSGDTIVRIVAEGQTAPGDTGTFISFEEPILNESGVVAFVARVFSIDGSTDGIFRGDGTNPVEEIIRTGSPSPDGIGTISSVDTPAFNNNGQAAFVGSVDLGDGGTPLDERVLVLAGGINPPVVIAREDSPVPGSGNPDLRFISLDEPAINDMGQVAFDPRVIDQMTNEIRETMYFFDPVAGLIEVLSTGAPLLGSTVTEIEFIEGTNNFSDHYANERNGINNQGQVAFYFKLEDDRTGVALWTFDSDLIPISLTDGVGMASGTLDDETDTDIYRFTLAGTSNTTIFTTGALDTRGVLTDASDGVINDPDLDDDAGTDSNFLSSNQLAAGTYEIAVSATTGGNYDLTVETETVSSPPTALPPVASSALLKSQTARKIKKLKGKFKKAKKSGNSGKALKFRKKMKKLQKILRSL